MPHSRPTLIIMAAGMGSRYGGLKQLDQFGPNGETIMDYSIFDAIKAGFGKVIFVVRKSFAREFEELVSQKLRQQIEIELVFQELDQLPEGFSPSKKRTKPWGTGHAVLVAKEVVNEPFAVINGDDFYGFQAFAALSEFLQNTDPSLPHYAIAAYPLGSTMSLHGAVSRGVCAINSEGMLINVTEYTNIHFDGENIVSPGRNNIKKVFSANTPVSMNCWGFNPTWFELAEQLFIQYLQGNSQSLTAEFYLPSVIDQLVAQNSASVKVLNTNAQWFGVTFQADKPMVQQQIMQLINSGAYPARLW